jgi:hypothetical protein
MMKLKKNNFYKSIRIKKNQNNKNWNWNTNNQEIQTIIFDQGRKKKGSSTIN